ncbi:DUF4097 family beta strand repeat-containing protein [Streptococcus pneumoniae]
MKKWKSFVFGAGLASLVLGMALSAIGIRNEGFKDIETAYGKVTFTEDISEKESKTLKKVSVDVDTQHVLIIPSLDNQIHIRYFVADKQKDKIRHTLKDGTLSIHEQNHHDSHLELSSGFAPLVSFIQHNQRNAYNVYIEVPEGLALNEVKATVLQGDIKIGDISSQTVFANSDFGNVNLEQTNFKKGEFKVNQGIIGLNQLALEQVTIKSSGQLNIFKSNLSKTDITGEDGPVFIQQSNLLESKVTNPDDTIAMFKGQLTSSQFKTTTGDINFSHTSFTGNNTATTQDGKTQMRLNQKELNHLHLFAQTKQGELTSDFDGKQSTQTYEHQVEPSGNNITLTSDTGDIEILNNPYG